MYKINHKAVVLVFLLQILVGFGWHSAAPASLIEHSGAAEAMPSIEHFIGFFLASLVYLYFSAWLLVKVNRPSSFSMMLLLLGVWLFAVLPNYLFISFYLNLDFSQAVYLLSYGAVSCLLGAIILPLWRASRSIFKG